MYKNVRVDDFLGDGLHQQYRHPLIVFIFLSWLHKRYSVYLAPYSEGIITSCEYPFPNYRYKKALRYAMYTTEMCAFQLKLTADLNSKANLNITTREGNYYHFSGTSFVDITLQLNSSKFIVLYQPAAEGEKGFKLEYFIGDFVDKPDDDHGYF
ncbi:unnamed protein product [Toxocara canis]|uniref:CUB domain-containing protein n=1 Tax=Toxocara canis TaxID=6265 RepID=A0A183U1Y2_TOXCA|nr:unnamed protein product [Toxocara canis]